MQVDFMLLHRNVQHDRPRRSCVLRVKHKLGSSNECFERIRWLGPLTETSEVGEGVKL